MKNIWILGLLACALPAGSMANKPQVSHAIVKSVEASMDQKLQALFSDNPVQVQVLGLTQGAYIDGYGAVFMSELNLAAGTPISPFHPNVTADEVKRIHDRKMERLSKLKEAMQQMLMDSAKSMDPVPADDQIALAISFFYWNWENKDGLPAQIVMHAPKKLLLDARTSAAAKSSILSDEF